MNSGNLYNNNNFIIFYINLKPKNTIGIIHMKSYKLLK
jgi:hypothetical protein